MSAKGFERCSGSNSEVSKYEGKIDLPSKIETCKEIVHTLPETNIVPENGWLEDEFHFGMAYFQGLC